MTARPATPLLRVFLDGDRFAEIAPPSPFAAGRDWILGVVALQASVAEGRASARLRAHVTGGPAASEIELGPRAVVQVALTFPSQRTPEIPPHVAHSALTGAARIAVFLDGDARAQAVLPRARLAALPPPRAFSHVYCRWLRDGSPQPGFDLTDFLALPPGTKYERLLASPLAPGQVVTITWDTGAAPIPTHG